MAHRTICGSCGSCDPNLEHQTICDVCDRVLEKQERHPSLVFDHFGLVICFRCVLKAVPHLIQLIERRYDESWVLDDLRKAAQEAERNKDARQ